GGLGAEHAYAPFDRIQIDLEDALLVEPELEHPRDHELLTLAQVVLLRGQEQILGQLLRDGRTATHDMAALLVALPGVEHRIEFVARMVDEIGILAGDHRALEVARDIVIAHPATIQRAAPDIEAAQAPAFGPHKGRRRWIHKLPAGDLHEEI